MFFKFSMARRENFGSKTIIMHIQERCESQVCRNSLGLSERCSHEELESVVEAIIGTQWGK